MNRSTRNLRKSNLATKVVKGTPVPKDSKPLKADSHIGVCLNYQTFPSTKGRLVDSGAERAAKGKKPYKGCGDPLGRKR